MTTRRHFLRQTIVAVGFAPFLPWDVARRAIQKQGVRVSGAIGSKQTVSDILVSFAAVAEDVVHQITFFRRSAPEVVLLHFALNQRASFRWCAAPGSELILAAGDVLDWRTVTYPNSPVRPEVNTMGHEVTTGRLIVDQAYYGNELDADG